MSDLVKLLRDNNWISTEPVTDTLSRWTRERKEAADRIAELEAQIAALTRWQKLESAPRKNEEDVLVYGPHGFNHLVVHFEEEDGLWYTLDGLGYREGAFTHWMPLPPPPNDTAQNVER